MADLIARLVEALRRPAPPKPRERQPQKAELRRAKDKARRAEGPEVKGTNDCTYNGCADLAEKGFARCRHHRIQIRIRAAEREAAYRRARRCYKCGRPRKPGCTTCKKCLTAFNKHRKRQVRQWKAAGLCTQCGAVPEPRTRPDGTCFVPKECERCLSVSRERTKKMPRRKRERIYENDVTRNERVARYKARQRALGNCITCGKPAKLRSDGEAMSMCEEHTANATARRMRAKQKAKAKSRSARAAPRRTKLR